MSKHTTIETASEWLLRVGPIAKRLHEQANLDSTQTKGRGGQPNKRAASI